MRQTSPNLDRVFFALTDSTRRAILTRLSQGSTTIGELSAPFDISKPAISKHMKILKNARLIQRRINGRQHKCTLTTIGLKTAEDWLNFHRRFWESRFDALSSLLAEDKSEQRSNKWLQAIPWSSRIFPADCERLFAMWTSAELMMQMVLSE